MTGQNIPGDSGSGVIINNGTLTLENGNIVNYPHTDTQENLSAGVCVLSGSFTMEGGCISDCPGFGVAVYGGGIIPVQQATPFTVIGWKTEKQLVESEDFHYVRLAITDRIFPLEPEVDQFIEVIKGMDMDKSWLHFHCMAGVGRTGIYMCFYDMMKNPDVPYEDILARQTMLGSS